MYLLKKDTLKSNLEFKFENLKFFDFEMKKKFIIILQNFPPPP
jgi:hypothetical protein